MIGSTLNSLGKLGRNSDYWSHITFSPAVPIQYESITLNTALPWVLSNTPAMTLLNNHTEMFALT